MLDDWSRTCYYNDIYKLSTPWHMTHLPLSSKLKNSMVGLMQFKLWHETSCLLHPFCTWHLVFNVDKRQQWQGSSKSPTKQNCILIPHNSVPDIIDNLNFNDLSSSIGFDDIMVSPSKEYLCLALSWVVIHPPILWCYILESKKLW